ncbi:hypothetical protein D770_04945 [Flammeovirgaceae bacterium 311]|nr:hypothetical protein D770_04945 [Flammeovirgaceae bacterium 311]
MFKFINEGFHYLLFGVAGFVFFIYTAQTKEKVTSVRDLVEVEGNYVGHSFKYNKEFKNFTHQYYIWTGNYKNAFQVKADYRGIFNKKEFALKVNHGTRVKFTIPNRLVGSLNSEKNIVVTSIVAEGNTYLDINEVLEIEKRNASSKSEYILSAVILVAGLFGFFREKLK